MLAGTQIDESVENFFVVNSALSEYTQTQVAMDNATKPPKMKTHKSLSKLLKECYFVGSLLYGNNFIA